MAFLIPLHQCLMHAGRVLYCGAATFEQMLDTTHRKSQVCKNKRGARNAASIRAVKTAIHKRYEGILPIMTSDLLAPVARQNISRQFVLVAGSVAFSL